MGAMPLRFGGVYMVKCCGGGAGVSTVLCLGFFGILGAAGCGTAE